MSRYQREDGTWVDAVVELTESKSILKGEPFPPGKQDDALLVYDTTTGESDVYKYISGDWRKL